MPTHIVHFYGPVTPGSVESMRNCTLSAIQQGKAQEVHLRLSSEGGALGSGFTAYYFLRSLPVPLTVHNTGNVESIAVLLFLAGATRLVAPHAKFTIHALHWGFGNVGIDHDRLSEFARSLDFDAERYAKIFDERTAGAKGPIDVRSHLAGRANIFGAEMGVSAGLATAIAEIPILPDAVHWWPDVVKT